MKNKEFIKEILKRIDKYANPDIWITEGDEIYTCEESIHRELLNTLENLGLEDCVCSDSELVDGIMYYGIHFV